MEINKPKISDGLIVGLTILFFPVAILLIVIRFLSHVNVNHMRDKDYDVIGHFFTWIWIIGSLVIFFSCKMDEANMTTSEIWSVLLVFAVVMLVPAFTFYSFGKRRRRKMQERYRLYYHLIQEQGVTDYNEISALTGIRYRNIEQDMRYIQTLDALTGNGFEAAINPNGSKSRTAVVENPAVEEAAPAVQRIAQTVVCRGCGSSAMVYPGEIVECEFCGNELAVK